MSQLSSSIRVARAALKHPVWQNRTQQSFQCQNGVVSKIAYHRTAVSARAFASAASSDSNFGTPIGRLHSLNGTMHNNMMSTPTLLSQKDTININNLPQDQIPTTAEAEKTAQTDTEAPVNIPFKRSKKTKSKDENVSSSDFDARAQAKLTALSHAKKEAENTKAAFLSMVWKPTQQGENSEDLHKWWNESEQKLALAYSQAIKYTSRITKNEKATKAAEKLLYEWMDRFMDPFGGTSVWMKDEKDTSQPMSAMYLNKKWMLKTLHAVLPNLTRAESNIDGAGDASASTLPQIRIPPPSSKDYTNLLRAYSLSKARRKGQQCEALMMNMMRLANTVSYYYDEESDIWTEDKVHDVGMESVVIGIDGSETKKWRVWVTESIPNSKAFALAIKSHAGSTHNKSFDNIILVNDIYDNYSDLCHPHDIPGMWKDDPYVLFHSIKALKNLGRDEERAKGHQWLGKLHKFVTSPENKDYFQEESVIDQVEGDHQTEEKTAKSETIDVTSAYTVMIRLMARLRGADGVAAGGRKVLDQMHDVRHIFENGLVEDADDTGITKNRIASIAIRSNAYNLVLGLYRDSKKEDDATKAMELLQRMVDAATQESDDRGGVPLPTEQSYEFAIGSLQHMSDGEKAIEEAERLIQSMQEPSVDAYNALVNVCIRKLFAKPQLYHKAMEILDKMNEMGKTSPGVMPNPETLALVMKACSLSEHEDHEKVLDAASDLFFQLKEQEPNEQSAVALTDRAYYNMMKCVDMHLTKDPDAKKELIETLFSEACERGLCSAHILTFFRNNVSKEEFRLTVGEGRLADNWIANIKGPRALYTDGSTGGADKHARRKGKSTSNWVKKQHDKESQKDTRRKDKKAKKFFKKMKAS